MDSGFSKNLQTNQEGSNSWSFISSKVNKRIDLYHSLVYAYLEINDAYRLRRVPAAAAGIGPGKPRGGCADKADAVTIGEGDLLLAGDLEVGEDAVPEGEPTGPPPLPVVGPLVEHPGNGDRRRWALALAAAPKHGLRFRRHRRAVADRGPVDRYAAERVHLASSRSHEVSESEDSVRRRLIPSWLRFRVPVNISPERGREKEGVYILINNIQGYHYLETGGDAEGEDSIWEYAVLRFAWAA